MMLPRVSGKDRVDFIVSLLGVMVKQGGAGLSADEFKDFKKKLREVITRTKPGDAEGNMPGQDAAGGG